MVVPNFEKSAFQTNAAKEPGGGINTAARTARPNERRFITVMDATTIVHAPLIEHASPNLPKYAVSGPFLQWATLKWALRRARAGIRAQLLYIYRMRSWVGMK